MAHVEQFHNLSSWRCNDVVIDPHETFCIDYLDTNPKMFLVVNANKCLLKGAISTIPTEDSYEFKVEYNCSEVFGRPTGTHKLYLLNDSDTQAGVKVFSVEQFDPTVLKNLNVNLKDYVLQTDTQIRGFGEGVSLPSGTNLIGYVGLSDADKTLLNNLPNILSRANTIDEKASTISGHLNNLILSQSVAGKKNLFDLSVDLQNVKKAILGTGNPTEYINLYYLLNDVIAQRITEIKTVINKWENCNTVSVKRENISTSYNASTYSRIRVHHFTNDGENEIKLTLTKNNNPVEITVKSGETFNDYSIESSQQNCSIAIEPLNNGEEISYRILFDYV